MAFQLPNLIGTSQGKTQEQLQAEALARRQQGQQAVGGFFSGVRNFFTGATQRANELRTQNQAVAQPQSQFQPQIGGFNIPTIQAVQPQAMPQVTQPAPQSNQSSFASAGLGLSPSFGAPQAQPQVQPQVQPQLQPQPQPIQPPPNIDPTTGFNYGGPVVDPTTTNVFGQPSVPPAQPEQPDLTSQLASIASGLQGVQSGLQAQPQQEEIARRRAEDELLRGLQISPEEEEAQKQLNALIQSRELGLRGVEEKPIAMEFITGQKAALERRAATQSLPLTQNLALLQARRQAATDVAKTKLDIEEARAKRAEGEIKQIDGNLVRVTPKGVETIFKAPAKAEKPVTVSPGGSLVDPSTGEVIFQAPRQQTETEIAKSLERKEKDVEARNTQAQTIGLVSNILNNPDLGAVSGVSRLFVRARLAGTAGVRAQLAQLEALTSLEGRSKLKGSGTISDFEAGMLADSANALNFAIEDDGRVRMPDSDVRRNLQNIRGALLLKAGQSVPAIITNPETGESISTTLTSKDANDLWLDGNIIDFQ